LERIRHNEKTIIAVEGVPFILIAAFLSLIAYFTGFTIIAIILGIVTIFIIWFFRNPERAVPKGRGLIVAPADGKIIEIKEVEDLLTESVYLVECDNLLNELNESGMALKFGFTNGNGYKVSKAYVYPSKIYKGYLFMSLGRTQISELIGEIDSIKNDIKKAKQITATIQGINRASVEELIAI